MVAPNGAGPRGFDSIETAGSGKAIIKHRQPIGQALAAGVVHERGGGLGAELHYVTQFQQGEATEPGRGMVCERVGVSAGAVPGRP